MWRVGYELSLLLGRLPHPLAGLPRPFWRPDGLPDTGPPTGSVLLLRSVPSLAVMPPWSPSGQGHLPFS